MIGLQSIGLTGKLLFATLVAGIGSGFQHGYNTGVVNAPQEVIEDWISGLVSHSGNADKDKDKVTLIWSFIVAIYCIGGVLGGFTSTFYAENLGRRGGLIFNNIFALIAAALMGFSKTSNSYVMLIVGRFFTGYNCGLNSALAVMYLVEIAPQQMRGAIASIYQLIITISILISQILGMKSVMGTDTLWPWLLGLIGIVAIIQALLLPLCPETPKYLFSKGKEENAQNALQWLRCDDAAVQQDMDTIKTETEQERSMGQMTCSQLWTNSVMRKALIVSLSVMLAQQLSGINAVIYYSTGTFKGAGLSDDGAAYGTLAMGAMNIVMTIVSVFLVEIAGRKTLLLAGFGTMFIDTLLLTLTMSLRENSKIFSYTSVLFVVLFVVCFATGPGSIPWFLVAEVFGNEARRHAASVSMATNWMANFLVGLTFPTLQNYMHEYVFLIFAGLQLFFFFIILLKVPETKNKTYEEVKKHFE